jgi:hypothetical protein
MPLATPRVNGYALPDGSGTAARRAGQGRSE